VLLKGALIRFNAPLIVPSPNIITDGSLIFPPTY
jgi:hypothetical protein